MNHEPKNIMSQKETFLRIHPHDNVLVALQNLEKGTVINFEGETFNLVDRVAAKHKFAINELPAREPKFICTVYW
jgi:altronate hydrolase